ncbi:MAG: universal stress protein [Xanthomonadales bacterium]|nr:universal stress protein [Xanthomonadales bacterium]
MIRSIVHPTDLSSQGGPAFQHALALALAAGPGAEFTILNASGEPQRHAGWHRFPPVRKTLERWQLLEPGSDKSRVYEELSIAVRKVALGRGRPLKAVLSFLEADPADLIVLGTEGRKGLPRWLEPSFAERLARSARTATLFVPRQAAGFVNPETGAVVLRRILVPIDRAPAPQLAVDRAIGAAKLTTEGPCEIVVFHAGPEDRMPTTDLSAGGDANLSRMSSEGEPVQAIRDAVDRTKADLIVMTTAGRHGILDALRGSVTEQVVRGATCPVLAVPEQ